MDTCASVISTSAIAVPSFRLLKKAEGVYCNVRTANKPVRMRAFKVNVKTRAKDGCSRTEQRAVEQFLVAGCKRNADTYFQVVDAYGEHCLGRRSVNILYIKFHDEQASISNLPKPRKANAMIGNESIAAVEEIIEGNRRVETRDICIL
ncbi:hypothetical protein NPIL_547511 [Nephila pilipes]|uniref:Uncharacterized protein n=1 Tax=Nephila pilipes TaxID=299642 RepID=A0A8X6U714_NEPPI|nr:hypothetical protein NPIL_547511 [Nephila pilipes]